MVTTGCSKKSLTANAELCLMQYEQLRYVYILRSTRYMFSSLGVRRTPLLIQVNMCKCRVVYRGENNVQHAGTLDHRVLLMLWEDHVVRLSYFIAVTFVCIAVCTGGDIVSYIRPVAYVPPSCGDFAAGVQCLIAIHYAVPILVPKYAWPPS